MIVGTVTHLNIYPIKKPVHLMHLLRGTWDAHSISLISHKTNVVVVREHFGNYSKLQT